MNVLRALFTLVLIFTIPAVAAAQQQEPSATHLAAAERVLDLTRAEEDIERSMNMMLAAQREQMQGMPQYDQIERIMREFLLEHLRWDAIRPDYVRMYAELFTEAELGELHAFYLTPLGQKLLRTAPAIEERTLSMVQRRLEPHFPEMQRRIMEVLEG
jgi:uncharacterized protein